MLTHLTLYTTQPQRLQEFYAQTLGIPTQSLDQGFDLTIGHTVIHWRQANLATPYHYAINIPSNKVDEALTWLNERVVVQPYKGDAIVDFQAWNAAAMYFYDSDHNIVELIARHNTQPEREEPFGVEQWLGVSEIGAPTVDMLGACTFLMEELGLPRYSGNLEQFAAIGHEEGLFILIKATQRDWMPNGDTAHPSPFQATITYNGQTHKIQYENALFTLLES